MSDVIDVLSKNIELAYEKARRYGRLVGIVSRRVPSKISKGENRVFVEVRPDTYYELGSELSIGNYLVAIDIRTLRAVGLKIISINRFDVASDLQLPSAISLEPDPEGLLSNTIVEAIPLLSEGGEPFCTVIEPQSPVILPANAELITKLIGLPSDGIVIGCLHSGSSVVADGSVPLKLPKVEFFKHILIIGTTGSGKTTFVKNLMYSLMNSWEDLIIVVIDAAGDYTQIVLPPRDVPKNAKVFNYDITRYPKWITTLVPLRKGDYDLKEFAVRYVFDRLSRITELFYGEKPYVEVSEVHTYSVTDSIVVNVRIGGINAFIEVIPISLSYSQLRDHLEIFPLFSRQAKVFLRNVLGYLESSVGGITNFTYLYRVLQEKFGELMKVLKIHRGTLENIERALNFIASSDEVDVTINRKSIGIPSINELVRRYRGPIILDLDYAASRGAHFIIMNLIAYEFLRSLYAWKKVHGDRPVIVVLDEAHRFFPSEGTSAEEVELLADFISRIARLGRSKGLGLIFSTHSPKDVHKIVIQLTNTKIIFRSEREYLEYLDIPREYIPILELAPDRVGLLRSSAVRTGYAMFETPKPLLGHFDIGRALT